MNTRNTSRPHVGLGRALVVSVLALLAPAAGSAHADDVFPPDVEPELPNGPILCEDPTLGAALGYNVIVGAGFITGTPNDDLIIASPQNDTVRALAGDDVVCLFDGNDRARGNAGNDTIYGMGGNDRVQGNDGDDLLDGGPGADLCDGGAGANTLVSC